MIGYLQWMSVSFFSPNTDPVPPLVLDRLFLDFGRSIHVVRDDLLPAGTKQRAVLPLLRDFQMQGVRTVVYASPFAGFAQIALAYGAQQVGLDCILYCERDPGQPGMQPHAFTQVAKGWGAKIFLANTLDEAEKKAEEAADKKAAKKIPLGFHCREFSRHFQTVVNQSLMHIRGQLGNFPRRVWLPVGSGTLAQAFRRATPAATELCCVNVHVLPEQDLRIQAVRAMANTKYYAVEQAFADKAREPPPIPSNIHYDAKLWSIIRNHAQNGDLWWNVAK